MPDPWVSNRELAGLMREVASDRFELLDTFVAESPRRARTDDASYLALTRGACSQGDDRGGSIYWGAAPGPDDQVRQMLVLVDRDNPLLNLWSIPVPASRRVIELRWKDETLEIRCEQPGTARKSLSVTVKQFAQVAADAPPQRQRVTEPGLESLFSQLEQE